MHAVQRGDLGRSGSKVNIKGTTARMAPNNVAARIVARGWHSPILSTLDNVRIHIKWQTRCYKHTPSPCVQEATEFGLPPMKTSTIVADMWGTIFCHDELGVHIHRKWREKKKAGTTLCRSILKKKTAIIPHISPLLQGWPQPSHTDVCQHNQETTILSMVQGHLELLHILQPQDTHQNQLARGPGGPQINS